MAGRALRRDMTPAELRLWLFLKNGQRLGSRFRRQCPLGPYLVDFYCPAARLVVEVDGPIHSTAEQREKDLNRDQVFRDRGITVLRFSNDQVLWGHRKVLAVIDAFLSQHQAQSNDPPP
ncbi:MAG: endonuclease domain-containing protein [bacterium]